MPKISILIVDSDPDLLALEARNLASEGYAVLTASTGEDALRILVEALPQLILLETALAQIDGFDVCRQLKLDSRTAHIPIIMISANGDDANIVAGLELGADDYLVKPFSFRVLYARIKAVLRRGPLRSRDKSEILHIHGMTIHPGRREVTVNGNSVDLTYSEFGVLYLLAKRPGWVFTRYQIVDGIRGDHYAVTERAVDVQIVGLRKKLGPAAQFIQTVRGVGYRLQEEEE